MIGLDHKELLEAIDNAASADNSRQTPLIASGAFAAVGRKRSAAMREFTRRLLEYLPEGATVMELREILDGDDE